ncbi:phosphatidylinositol-4-phosphate 5-kinase fab1 [Metarhizium album ARSEF 1941]|uniref:1-phosphatidylinositol-3-phosphate 5-kinase n=1 Tax=Metarhizium album (strain ARSEF 1941) TaxID=1081103 RepID=A0A0B2WDN5_METAS|nr:phosphatidylinositol-4-phosphate 5-kinase fab1 [Metarhizium album ARSEF 1941]KHN93986.1 phosphatidylinositol-4-phosphate 5-kinase fab1 [Metarhizium album ARSEF 1941]
MASSTASKATRPASPTASMGLSSPVSFRKRRGSTNSISSTIDKEQLAQALDQIHTSASRCESLTTFNDFAPPPEGISTSENRPGAGELVQNGLSGLYNRFREAVGGSSPSKTTPKEAKEGKDSSVQTSEIASKRSSTAATHSSRPSVSSLMRADTNATIMANPLSTMVLTDASSPTTASGNMDTRPQLQSTKSNSINLMTGPRSSSSSRQSLPTKATSSVVADPTIAPPASLKRDASRSTIRTEDSGGQGSSRRSLTKAELQTESASLYDAKDGRLPPRAGRDDESSADGSLDAPFSPVAGEPSTASTNNGRHHARGPSVTSSLLHPDDMTRTPAVIDRISRSRSPRYSGSRGSSLDVGIAAASAINTSAHGSVFHDSFSQEIKPNHLHPDFGPISGTTSGQERASDQMNAQLDKMRRQVLSKEFWMKDDTVKECFLCQTPFTAFRRKHHCRTCGCIFDSKCTTVVSGEKFGVQGSLRVCKNCLEVISRRFDGSGSDDSGDERSFLPKIFGPNNPKESSETVTSKSLSKTSSVAAGSEGSEDSRPLTTPMMAIPATRRMRDSANRASAVLEIGSPQLSRPGSSRSLKSLTTSGRPQSSAGHRRHHSKHGFLGRFKPAPDQQAPFRKGIEEESSKKPKFPAFHDDNIIDPDLADYMSEDSSGDEQMGIFATMTAASDVQPTSYEHDRSTLPSYLNQARKYRHRPGEKSISGMSYVSRGVLDDTSGPISLLNHRRSTRRRNLSISGSAHHHGSPRPKSAVYKGPSASSEALFGLENTNQPGTQLTRSDSLRRKRIPKQELNRSSLKHVDRLLYQLLDDAQIPNPGAWQKSLVPILLQLTDDVTPDVAKGEDMDLRHYVKLKKIPGGRPGDTSYISGVVFTKNLALKRMPRRIANPRIVLVTFPIEYQRHQQHFMSLQPVIEQEKEFLRVVVQRITNLRPHLLLAQKGVSGVALQYLSEANISVAYNVKDTVIEAVARCAEAEIIESLDMLALPVRVGRCSAFEVRTFVNNDYPGRKKSYIFLSGCRPDLGCTIALRGASGALLKKVKHIMEFMVYVVYNLKLESSLLRDESVEPPEDSETSLSNSIQALNDSFRSISSAGEGCKQGPTVVVNHPSSESEPPSQVTVDSLSTNHDDAELVGQVGGQATQPTKVVSLHAHHTQAPHDSQVPDDIPMPTFYSDMVAKYETKILSASPYVKFKQPYLLMKAREQERRLLYLRRLRDQDAVEEESEKACRHRFQLIKPEMVEKIGQKAPRQVMEVLHAVHDAEYDKALFNYQTQTRQWEAYIQGNIDLFDPYSHQNIVVLYSVICTDTKIPCIEPGLVAINFYDEQHVDTGMDADCTLGQYIEDLAYGKNDVCNCNGCEKKLVDHHRTYVHDEYRITVFVEHVPNPSPRRPELGDGITMWTFCKLCKKDSEETAMSDATFKYSFGKYLELLYWGRGLKIKNIKDCPHDQQHDHVRYFSLRDSRVRIHWDPIDLLEIVVPRARITWKVANDLKLKNEIYNKMEERWSKFMASVRARLKSIRTESLLPEKAESCKAEVERLMKKTQEEQPAIIRQMQRTYVESKYYEVVPFNKIIREMLEKAGEWDQAFSKFEADFLGDKDMRQITMMQLKKIFTDNESKESLASNDGTGSAGDGEDRPSQTFTETAEKSTQPTEYTDTGTEASLASSKALEAKPECEDEKVYVPAEGVERVEGLDLARSPEAIATSAPSPQSSASTETASRIPIAQTPVASRPLASPTGNGRHPTDTSISSQSLSERIDQMRREQAMQVGDGITILPKAVPERGSSRKSGSNISPPIVRATSHPVRTLPTSQSAAVKPNAPKDGRSSTAADSVAETLPEGSIKVDKKLSDRLGLTALKNRSKTATSGIPRLSHKKKESKVSTLARHFEQLSREFEKERIRDRKERAASLRQPRARLPRTSTKAIVQVYGDVSEAFEEPLPSSEQMPIRDGDQNQTNVPVIPESSVPKPEPAGVLRTHTEPNMKADDETAKSETENTPGGELSQATSDDEALTSDIDSSITDEFLPDLQELAEALEPSTDIPDELPKHQKTSLMKYLANFWAETSASGWPPLEYPISPTDHIFVDSDIIVREDEPSSVIALALNSDDYQAKLAGIMRDYQEDPELEVDGAGDGEPRSVPVSDIADGVMYEADLEKSLLRVTGTHLKYQFKEGAAIMTCKIFYAEQFDALRRKCGVAERIIESLSRCLKWDSRGGKTKSVFLKTLDDRLVLKSLSPIETSAFLRFAPSYFSIMAEALFHELPSVIAKMLGFFQVIIKNPTTGADVKLDLLITENLFYDRSPTRIFDLKGSMRNRKIQSTGEQNEVLLDENMVEYIYESPLFAREHSKKLLRASVWNDTLFLARQNVMDYSLMIAVDEERKELVVGIIDCIRTYTWDKKLESWIKDRGFAGGGRNRPTVTSPKEYKSRFREAMARYILQAPNRWHLFNNPQLSTNYAHARFEEPEAGTS